MLYRIEILLASLIASAPATAAELRFDPQHEPRVIADAPELGPGAIRLRFEQPRVVEAAALPAAVVVLPAGVEPPPELIREGEKLGRSGRFWRVPARDGEDAVQVSRRWAGHPAVKSVVPDLVLGQTTYGFDDPKYSSQWYMTDLEMDPLFALSTGSPDVRAAVIDSAVEIGHVDLEAGFVEPYDAYDGDDDPSPNPGEFCYGGSASDICDEHGTAVAGIMGARANNGEGIVGFCPDCTLIPIKLLGEENRPVSTTVAAFEHAVDSGAWVINNSWGYTTSTPVPSAIAEVIAYASTEGRGGLGAVVVFAAGNDDRAIADDEMQALPEVLCVGATDTYGNPTAYTNFGPGLDIAAPSATISTSVEDGYTSTFGGTSAASPVVAGMAAWILSVRPELSAEEVRALLVETAVQSYKAAPDEEGHDDYYGWGELSATNLLEAVAPAEDTGDGSEERPGGCACGTVAGPTATWLLLPLLALLRRRQRA